MANFSLSQSIHIDGRNVIRTSDDKDTVSSRTTRDVSNEELNAALDRLDKYIETQFKIHPNSIHRYFLSDHNDARIEYDTRDGRKDTSFVIPSSVNFPEFLLLDYGNTIQKYADEQLRKADIQIANAEKFAKQADELTKHYGTQKKQLNFNYSKRVDSANNQSRYQSIEINTSDNEIKTISSDSKGNITVSTSKHIGKPRNTNQSNSMSLEERFEEIDENVDEAFDSLEEHDEDGDDDDEMDEDEDESHDDYKTYQLAHKIGNLFWRKDRFRGHWAGIELGFNWLLSPQGNIYLSGENAPMRMNLASAINWNINFFQYSIPIYAQHFGLVFGIGANMNFMRFKNKNTMVTGENHISFNSDLQASGHIVKSSQFFNLALTLPLLFEYQMRGYNTWKRFYIAAGALLNVRIHSSTKIVYDRRRKMINSDSFNMHDVSFAPTLRIGYGIVRLYANFYPMGFFEKGMGPKLYPLEVGLVLFRF